MKWALLQDIIGKPVTRFTQFRLNLGEKNMQRNRVAQISTSFFHEKKNYNYYLQ